MKERPVSLAVDLPHNTIQYKQSEWYKWQIPSDRYWYMCIGIGSELNISNLLLTCDDDDDDECLEELKQVTVD